MENSVTKKNSISQELFLPYVFKRKIFPVVKQNMYFFPGSENLDNENVDIKINNIEKISIQFR